jgi:hypothetical protein
MPETERQKELCERPISKKSIGITPRQSQVQKFLPVLKGGKQLSAFLSQGHPLGLESRQILCVFIGHAPTMKESPRSLPSADLILSPLVRNLTDQFEVKSLQVSGP